MIAEDRFIDIPLSARAVSVGERITVGQTLDEAIKMWEATLGLARKCIDLQGQRPEPEKGIVMREVNDVEIESILSHPSKIIGIGLNYRDHCREQKVEPPRHPILFAKFPQSIVGPGGTIRWNRVLTEKVDFEAELAVVISKRARQVPVDKAMDCVAGFTALNDVSARDLQFGDKQWTRGKSLDTFCPMGPVLVTPDEIGEGNRLAISCSVNGVVYQDSNTSEMIFSVRELIAFITQGITLEPGDVIATGTPHGVGVFRRPPVFLKDGDEVVVTIEKIGELRNRVETFDVEL